MEAPSVEQRLVTIRALPKSRQESAIVALVTESDQYWQPVLDWCAQEKGAFAFDVLVIFYEQLGEIADEIGKKQVAPWKSKILESQKTIVERLTARVP